MAAKILIAIPTYCSQMHAGVLPAIMRSTKNHEIELAGMDSSATCMTMNLLWLNAQEMFEKGVVTHFLMYHTDIVAEDWFLDKMMDIMEEKKADVLSAIVPIKDQNGFTSTALDEPMGDMDPYWRVRRLTLREIYKNYPATFTHPKLLLNTGLMLVDLSKPWVKDAYFTIEDSVITWRDKRVPVMFPEDWGISRMARKAGASLWATREVKLSHYGLMSFPNTHAWGLAETDTIPPPPDPVVDAAVESASKIEGYMADLELRWLATKAKDAETIVEIGSWKGRSTKALAMATKGVVYCVDTFEGSSNGDATGVEATEKGSDAIYAEFKRNLAPEIASGKVVVIHVNHALAVPEVRAKLGDTLADFVFIDGDHEYANIKRDIQNFIPLVREGGIISGHDLCDAHPGVFRAVKESFKSAKIEAGSIWAATIKGEWRLVDAT